jgi:hypothetical protein
MAIGLSSGIASGAVVGAWISLTTGSAGTSGVSGTEASVFASLTVLFLRKKLENTLATVDAFVVVDLSEEAEEESEAADSTEDVDGLRALTVERLIQSSVTGEVAAPQRLDEASIDSGLGMTSRRGLARTGVSVVDV